MSDIPIRAEGVKERDVGGERMLYNVAGRSVHVLNGTADFVWQRCDGKRSVEEIAREALQAFDAPEETVRSDVEACVAVLRERGVLRPA